MSKTNDYVDYLDEHIDISPANSQEELQAARTIAEVFADHGLEPRIQEFDAPSVERFAYGIVFVLLFAAIILSGVGGIVVRIIGAVLTLLCVGLLISARFGRDRLEGFGPTKRSQNVIACRRASGPLVSKGTRPIVIVAHYDSPREDILSQSFFAPYRAAIIKVAMLCVPIVGVAGLAQLLLFLPEQVRLFLWTFGVVAALPCLLWGASIISQRFMPCTEGANDNKSSVAAMLGILDHLAPGSGMPVSRRVSQRRKEEPDSFIPFEPEEQKTRHGAAVLRAIGMLPDSCEIEYVNPAPAIPVLPVIGRDVPSDDFVDAQQEFSSEDTVVLTADAIRDSQLSVEQDELRNGTDYSESLAGDEDAGAYASEQTNSSGEADTFTEEALETSEFETQDFEDDEFGTDDDASLEAYGDTEDLWDGSDSSERSDEDASAYYDDVSGEDELNADETYDAQDAEYDEYEEDALSEASDDDVLDTRGVARRKYEAGATETKHIKVKDGVLGTVLGFVAGVGSAVKNFVDPDAVFAKEISDRLRQGRTRSAHVESDAAVVQTTEDAREADEYGTDEYVTDEYAVVEYEEDEATTEDASVSDSYEAGDYADEEYANEEYASEEYAEDETLTDDGYLEDYSAENEAYTEEGIEDEYEAEEPTAEEAAEEEFAQDEYTTDEALEEEAIEEEATEGEYVEEGYSDDVQPQEESAADGDQESADQQRVESLEDGAYEEYFADEDESYRDSYAEELDESLPSIELDASEAVFPEPEDEGFEEYVSYEETPVLDAELSPHMTPIAIEEGLNNFEVIDSDQAMISATSLVGEQESDESAANGEPTQGDDFEHTTEFDATDEENVLEFGAEYAESEALSDDNLAEADADAQESGIEGFQAYEFRGYGANRTEARSDTADTDVMSSLLKVREFLSEKAQSFRRFLWGDEQQGGARRKLPEDSELNYDDGLEISEDEISEEEALTVESEASEDEASLAEDEAYGDEAYEDEVFVDDANYEEDVPDSDDAYDEDASGIDDDETYDADDLDIDDETYADEDVLDTEDEVYDEEILDSDGEQDTVYIYEAPSTEELLATTTIHDVLDAEYEVLVSKEPSQGLQTHGATLLSIEDQEDGGEFQDLDSLFEEEVYAATNEDDLGMPELVGEDVLHVHAYEQAVPPEEIEEDIYTYVEDNSFDGQAQEQEAELVSEPGLEPEQEQEPEPEADYAQEQGAEAEHQLVSDWVYEEELADDEPNQESATEQLSQDEPAEEIYPWNQEQHDTEAIAEEQPELLQDDLDSLSAPEPKGILASVSRFFGRLFRDDSHAFEYDDTDELEYDDTDELEYDDTDELEYEDGSVDEYEEEDAPLTDRFENEEYAEEDARPRRSDKRVIPAFLLGRTRKPLQAKMEDSRAQGSQRSSALAQRAQDQEASDDSAQSEQIIHTMPSWMDDTFPGQALRQSDIDAAEAQGRFVPDEDDLGTIHGDDTGIDIVSYDSFDDSSSAAYSSDDAAVSAEEDATQAADWGTTTYVPDTSNIARRAALFDLPDPTQTSLDPFSPAMRNEQQESLRPRVRPDAFPIEGFYDDAAAPQDGKRADEQSSSAKSSVERKQIDGDAPRPGRSRRRFSLFNKRDDNAEESLSAWLGVDDDFDAKKDGRRIGSWDNFSDDDDENDPKGSSRPWKGGATHSISVDAAGDDHDHVGSQEELIEAISSLSDDELLCHDIWFVAVGSNARGNAGIKAFLSEYRMNIRGAFLINLDSVGAGNLSTLSDEGLFGKRLADRRLLSLLHKTADDLGIQLGQRSHAWAETDATPAMRKSIRSVTIMGLDEADGPALSHSAADIIDNVDSEQIDSVVDLICELIRRS